MSTTVKARSRDNGRCEIVTYRRDDLPNGSIQCTKIHGETEPCPSNCPDRAACEARRLEELRDRSSPNGNISRSEEEGVFWGLLLLGF